MRRTTILTALAGLALPLGLPALPAAAAGETCDGKAATIVVPAKPGARATDPVLGTPGDDVIVGTEQDDTIDGAGGNDTICALRGADLVVGGPGDDRLFGGLDTLYSLDDGYFGDLVVPGPGDDLVDLGADPQLDHLWRHEYPLNLDQVSYASASAGVVVDLAAGTASGEGADTIAPAGPGLPRGVVGSAFDDRLAGSSELDLIADGGGDDVVDGRGGDDQVSVDATGRSTATGSGAPAPSGDDTVFTGPGDDWVTSGSGRDVLRGGGGKDHVSTRSSTPGTVLEGGAERDVLTGPVGATLRGGSGDDRLEAEFAPGTRQEVDGDRGRDRVNLRLPRSAFEPGQHIVVDVPREWVRVNGRRVVRYQDAEKLFLAAPRGRVTYLGAPAAELFYASGRVRVRAWGRGGADVLYGGSFADLLDGGPGRDRLDGRSGRDRCLRGERLRSCEVRR